MTLLLSHLPPVPIEQVAMLHVGGRLEDEIQVVYALGLGGELGGKLLVLELRIRHFDRADARAVDGIDTHFHGAAEHLA